MVVREDSMTLYAFAADDERDIFEVIQGVQGIGPKTGLALLAVLGPDGLRRAVHAEDAKAVARVPGIGPKTAQRVILELGGKLAPPTADGTAAALTSAGGMGAGGSPGSSHTQVIEALVGLGFAEKNAVAALATITKAADAPTDTGALLRATLRLLGGGRG
jgi:Holliday junction DNA helicase RuvA